MSGGGSHVRMPALDPVSPPGLLEVGDGARRKSAPGTVRCPGARDRGVASADLGLCDARSLRPTPPMPRRVPIGTGRRCSRRPRRSPASARSATRPTRPPKPPRRSFTSDARTPPAAPPRAAVPCSSTAKADRCRDRQARQRGDRPHRPRAPARRVRQAGPVERRDRRAARALGPHRRVAPLPGDAEARRQRPPRAVGDDATTRADPTRTPGPPTGRATALAADLLPGEGRFTRPGCGPRADGAHAGVARCNGGAMRLAPAPGRPFRLRGSP